MGKLSAVGQPTRPTQPVILVGSIITWFTGMETIKRLRMDVWLQTRVLGCGLVCTLALHSAATTTHHVSWLPAINSFTNSISMLR